MESILRILTTASIVLLIPKLVTGIYIDGFLTSIVIAVVLSLLNLFVKPLLILFTLPITIVTLGLFLLVINALMIELCAYIVDGFNVKSLWTALLFSIILSITQSIVFSLVGLSKKKEE